MRRSLLALVCASLIATMLPAGAVLPRGGGSVTIYDDDFGVPHVVGETEEAMAFGAGYVVGRDRLFETDVIRRLGQGRLSEILGEDMLEADMVLRREFYDPADIRAQVAALPPRTRRLLQAYADGMNAAIAEQTADPTKLSVMFGALGYVPEPWTMEDSAAVLLLFTMVEFAGEGEGGELRNAQLLAELIAEEGGDEAAALAVWQDILLRNDTGAVAVIPEGEEPPAPFISAATPSPEQIALARALNPTVQAAIQAEADMLAALRSVVDELPVPRVGSYAMAATGDRTSSGGTILLGAPQAGFFAPSLFYEMGLHAPGWDCTGFTVPGLGPFMGIGWCNQHAWTLVAGNAGDQVDLIVETLCDDGGGYLYEGTCRPIETRTERYVVKSTVPLLDGNPPDADVVTQEIRSTRHGPIFFEDGTRAYVFKRAQAGHFTDTFPAVVTWNTAQSLDELMAGSDVITGSYNLVYADEDGNIAYRFTGYQPVRAATIDHRLPTPGDAARFEWQARTLPFNRMPHVTNPEGGLLVVDQGVDSKPAAWWPRASDVSINRFSHTRADYDTWAPETALDIARVKQLNRYLISDADTLALQVEALIHGALSEDAPGVLGTAFALFDEWREAGYPRVDANADGKLDHPAITIFSPDGLNFRRSGLWGRFIDRFWRARVGRPIPGPFVGRLGQTLAAIESPELFGSFPVGNWKADFRAALADEIAALTVARGPAMATWLSDAPTVRFEALGVVAPPRMKVVDHGTYSQIVDLGTRAGVNINPPGNGRADTAAQVALATAGELPRHMTDQIALYEAFEFKPMKMAEDAYTAAPEMVTTLFYPGTIA